MRHVVARTAVLVVLLSVTLGTAGPAAHAAPVAGPRFIVNSTADVAGAPPLNDGICATAYNSGQPNGTCTLRAAIDEANNWPGGGATITLPAQPPGVNYTLFHGTLTISQTMTIVGGGAGQTIVDGHGTQLIFWLPQSNLTLIGLTLQGASDPGGYGGAIGNLFGTLTVISSTVRGNVNGYGGGILNEGNALLVDTTLSGNVATAVGGGLDNVGTATLVNSTISGNSAGDYGGGIYTAYNTVSLYNVTIADNKADSNLDGVGTGGGVYNSNGAVTQLQDSLLADNLASDFDPERNVWFFTSNDCAGSLTTLDYNLISDTSGCAFTATLHDHTNVAAHLGPLHDNGGPTWTQALLPGSPAIDAGDLGNCHDNFGAPLTTDQRGLPRKAFGGSAFRCDIGAFEVEQTVDLPLIRK